MCTQGVGYIVCLGDQGKLGSLHEGCQYGHHSLACIHPGLQCAPLCIIRFSIMRILQALGHRAHSDAHYTLEIFGDTVGNTD